MHTRLHVPTTIIAFGLIFMRGYIELGVPTSKAYTGLDNHTWLWELLFTNTILVIVILSQLEQFLAAKTSQQRWLGNNVFGSLNMCKRIGIAIIAGILMNCVVIISHAVEQYNIILAISSGLAVCFYLCILAVIDLARPDYYELRLTINSKNK